MKFEGATMDNDYGRLSKEEIERSQKFASRANAAKDWVRVNGIPAGYQESIDVYKAVFGKSRTNAPINFEDLYALDQAVSRTIWDVDTFSQIGLPTSMVDKPGRWQLKDYLVQSEANDTPNFTKTFRNPRFIRMKESSQFTDGVGLQLGISIPFTDIIESEGALWQPQAILMQELAARFGLQKSRRGWLGTDCLGAMGDDGSDASTYGIKGLFNAAGVQQCAIGATSDNDVTAQGDIEQMVRQLLVYLKKCYQPGKYILVTTCGIASEMFLHRDTYQQRFDSERVKELLSIMEPLQRNGLGFEWYATDQLVAAAPTTSNQKVMLIKAAPSLIQRKIVYNTQMLPMANKLYEQDIQENMIFGDIIQVKKVDTTNNAFPIVVAYASASTNCTATSVGFIPDGTRII